MGEEVSTIGIVKPLAERAQKLLAELGYRNVMVKHATAASVGRARAL
jgi:protein-L-isoaspartate O-methyltransferase